MLLPPPILRPDALKSIDTLIRADFIAYRETCFNWLLAATGLVVAGLALEGPELWHEITSINRHWRFRRRFHFSLPEEHAPNWATLLAFVGWLLIVVGVAGEYVADSFVSRADGYVQTFDEILLTETQNRTALASERASAAYERASENEGETAATLRQAEQERADAAKSLAAAESATKEAKGYSLQIAQANERAANAEKRAAEAELELARIKSPRSLTHVPELIAALELFKGTEYRLNVFQDDESIQFTKIVDDALNRAGWVRKPAYHLGITSIQVFGNDREQAVPICIETGIQVHFWSNESLAVLNARSFKDQSPTLRAAATLRAALVSSISPQDNRNVGDKVILDENSLDKFPLVICIGKKP